MENTDIKTIRDLIHLRSENNERFSKALSHIVLEDFDTYIVLLDCIDRYDTSSGGAKTSIGYQSIPEEVDPDLRNAIAEYVRGLNG